MKLVLDNPCWAELVDWPESAIDKLRNDLTYKDLRVAHEVQRLEGALKAFQRGTKDRTTWAVQQKGVPAVQEEIRSLKEEIYKSALIERDDKFFVYSGYVSHLSKMADVQRNYEYPEPGTDWIKEKPGVQLRWYQDESVEKLLEAKHGAVQLATGAGKTLILLELARRLNLPTLIMAPTTSIAEQLLDKAIEWFGKASVGQCFGSKKESHKKFVIGISKGMTLLKPGNEHFENIASKKVFIGDESHTLGADTLNQVCTELCKDIPYRFFVSGTQMRNDGLGVVLDGLIGPVLMDIDVKQLTEMGFLTPGEFYQVPVPAEKGIRSFNPIELTRHHVHRNHGLAKKAADFANKAASNGKKVLILIDEIDQFMYLYPHLKHDCGFAYGTLDKANKRSMAAANIPEKYFRSKPKQLVKDFDSDKFPILIGTSCIGVGTDIQTADFGLDLYGGASEIRLRQAIGRFTRLAPNKTKFKYIDFIITGVPQLMKQAEKRAAIMETIGPVKQMP